MRSLVYSLLIAFTLASTACAPTKTEAEKETPDIRIPEGFEIELLYSPGEHGQGSWVSMAEDDKGNIYACDQYGPIYRFPKPALGEKLDSNLVDSLDLPIGHAQGLLWAFNSLYVMVNRDTSAENASGLYRLSDTNSDGELDNIEAMLQLDGRGEHGPHSIVLDPSGEYLYFVAGNHTKIPESLTESRLPKNWGEDNLFKPYLDARGHAVEVEAPGGWIARTNASGDTWELMAAGFRNSFDIAFNADGELFTFDSDMEWDFGMPWYRPIRVCHAVSGADFGWRTGSGKWPVYYPDNLPGVVNLGQGSPTGVLMGDDLNFPSAYKESFYVLDWSFGTMYQVQLQPDGASYKAAVSQFLSGEPLPLTDAIAGSDGALYFATGGRRLDSHLYRLTYAGGEQPGGAVAENAAGKEERSLRRSLEAYHNKQSPEAIPAAWPRLKNPDRFIRYAARMVLEHQPFQEWKNRWASETEPASIIQSTIAVARSASPSYQNEALRKLEAVNWDALSTAQRIDLLRAYNLLFIRMGSPSASQKAALVDRLGARLPAEDPFLNRELSQVLTYLGDPQVIDFALGRMETSIAENVEMHPDMLPDEISGRSERYGKRIKEVKENMPPTEAIYYAALLSRATQGWNDRRWEKYFDWYVAAFNREGGMSYKGFLDNIRQRALKNVPAEKRTYHEERSGFYSPTKALADLPQPKGPGSDRSNRDVNKILGDGLKEYKGEIADGKYIYEAALCAFCHRMNGEGGDMGPDLTQAHTRFNRGEIVYATVNPHETISDQYAFTYFVLKNGRKFTGRAVNEDEEKLYVMTNPFAPDQMTEILKSEIEKQEISPVSPMPGALLNRLNEQELLDLFAYLMSGGDEDHEYYTGEKAASD